MRHLKYNTIQMSTILYKFSFFNLLSCQKIRLGSSQDLYYLLFLFSGSMFKPLQTTLFLHYTCQSLHQPHTSMTILSIVISFWISSIATTSPLFLFDPFSVSPSFKLISQKFSTTVRLKTAV